MEEYERLGHMQEVTLNDIHKPYYFLPHHCVIKPDSSTTKLRVVFDGSAKTSSNVSLNDILSKGPTIQDDVFTILLRFRMPRFAFTADIEKMYRQVNLDEKDRKYQLIWWRNDPSHKLKCFQLTTVTYGTTSAPYLATKCLQRLAEEESEQYQLGSEVLRRDFYVDDVLTGTNSLQTAIHVQRELQDILQKGGFKLRKWCANHPRLLENIPTNDRELQLNFETKNPEHIKTMGLTWLPKTDEFCIKTTWDNDRRITKRTAYSDIARLFDPLGVMGPVVITAKIFLQQLWALKLDWDAALPQELHSTWSKYREGLQQINNIKFPRHVFAHRTSKLTQLHIFADASEKAYGTAAYVRSIDNQNIITVRLLCAKSRVAPLKQTTLPRLELCAAKLAAELAQRLRTDLNLKSESIYLWSDSEITLSWINSSSSSFQTFVANRISRIQEITNPSQWRHVNSKDNPADILSRGIDPQRLASSNLWFYGPTFLHGNETIWPSPCTNIHTEYTQERKRAALTITKLDSIHPLDGISHKNSFRKLQRIIAYVLRFINNTRKLNKNTNAEELDKALMVIVRTMQEQGFGEDLKQLKRYGELPKNSPLSNLCPFLDDQGIARVGGRLEASSLSFDAKHPILIPCGHAFTKLLLNDLHNENHHVGPQGLLAIARQRFWPIKGKTLTRSIYQNCTHCARARPKMLSQLMGNLPSDRVQPARPFVNCGVDFCGPVWTHFKIRGKKPQKSYIAVFVCFSTRAVHLELVTDLTSEGFIGSLKRFMGRRGNCQNIYCDNATNFVGAKNQIKEIKEMIESSQSQTDIITACSTRGLNFHFIPPRTPHFGGLWEAAVKSAKHLLQKTLSAASLTYEELETVIIEVEAILNSRPITPMSSDPNDITALTPGHFLIGEPLTTVIDPAARSQNMSLLNRWKLVSYIKGEFWRRWSSEYLNQLQHRYKWKERCQNVQPGMMVIIKDDNLPPLKWPLGRIIKTIKGEDGLVRVSDVRTAHGVVRRAIHRLAPLPMEDHLKSDEESSKGNNRMQQEPSSSKEDTDDQTKINPRKKKKNSFGSAIVTLLLTCCLVFPTTQGSPVVIEPFKFQPGIYFENLGTTNLISSEWNLVVYFDMRLFWTEFDALKNCSHSLKTLCDLLLEKGACEDIITHFQHLIFEFEGNNELLRPTQQQLRNKRGAINIVGNIANALFGVLDSQYAEEMAGTIDKLQNNEEYLLQLIKNQTSMIDSTINVMRRNQESIQEQFSVWKQHMDQFTKQINLIHQEFYQQKLSTLFISLSMHAMMTAANFQRIQGCMLDVLADTHHGKISPQLITPRQMRKELATIKNYLPASLRLPAAQEDVLHFYNLMTIEGRPAENYLIFKLSLPLLAAEDFELFGITPVPVLINNTFSAIRPSYPYLVVNLHRDQYYPLAEHELHSCVSTAGTRHLCKQLHPVYRRGSTISACEIELLNHMQQGSVCDIETLQDGPHWIQLHYPNNWIYVLKQRTTINVVCGDNVTQLPIEGSGILKLCQPECIIKQDTITIKGHNIFPASTKISYLPQSNLSIPTLTSEFHTLKQSTFDYHADIKELGSLKDQLKQFQHLKLDRVQQKDIHHFTISYLSLLLVVIVLIYIIWKYCPRLQHYNKKTSKEAKQPESKDEENNSFRISFDS